MDREGYGSMYAYEEVASKIKARIDRGEWPPGGVLPTTEEFAQVYGVSESTAYHALRHLRDQDLIVAVQGGRRYVADREPDVSPEV